MSKGQLSPDPVADFNLIKYQQKIILKLNRENQEQSNVILGQKQQIRILQERLNGMPIQKFEGFGIDTNSFNHDTLGGGTGDIAKPRKSPTQVKMEVYRLGHLELSNNKHFKPLFSSTAAAATTNPAHLLSKYQIRNPGKRLLHLTVNMNHNI